MQTLPVNWSYGRLCTVVIAGIQQLLNNHCRNIKLSFTYPADDVNIQLRGAPIIAILRSSEENKFLGRNKSIHRHLTRARTFSVNLDRMTKYIYGVYMACTIDTAAVRAWCLLPQLKQLKNESDSNHILHASISPAAASSSVSLLKSICILKSFSFFQGRVAFFPCVCHPPCCHGVARPVLNIIWVSNPDILHKRW